MISSLADLIFDRLYSWAGRLSNDDLYQYTACSLFTILLTFNVITLYSYGKLLITGRSPGEISTFYAAVLGLVIMYSLYLRYVRNKTYRTIHERLKNDPVLSGNASSITVIYIVASLAGFISLVWA